jgi:exodeoxyribonuclease VII small subunit
MTTKKADKDKAREPVEADFEKSMKRLETIVGEMEGGSLRLEAMIERFEEGQALIRVCSRKLNEVERKIELLVKKGDALETEAFDEAAAQDEGAEGGPGPAGEKDKEDPF